MNLFLGILYGIFGQIISFLILQGSYKYKYIQDNVWLIALSGIPTALLFYKSVYHFIIAFNGELWPSRLLGFAIGAIVFYLMSTIIFKEPLSLKTIICLVLSIAILLIQIYWKK